MFNNSLKDLVPLSKYKLVVPPLLPLDFIFRIFPYYVSSNKFSKEERNLLIYKKALFNSSLVDESALIESLKPILNKESFWQAHALLLLGDYFMSKGESIKAIEFYQKIFTISNLHHDIYNHARFQLALLSHE